MSLFPLNIEEKEDHPDQVEALKNLLSKYYTDAATINKIVAALTELNLSKAATADLTSLNQALTEKINQIQSGIIGTLFIAGLPDGNGGFTAPTADGNYNAGEAGTYTGLLDNDGDAIVVTADPDLTNSTVILNKKGSVWTKIVRPLGFEVPTLPTPGAPDAAAPAGEFTDRKSAGESLDALETKVSDGLRYTKVVSELLNDLDETLGSATNYAQASFVYVPTDNNDQAGAISHIHATLTGALVGRTIGLVLLTPTTGTSFITNYIGPEYAAEVAGDNTVQLPSPIAITAGQKFGILVRTADTTKSISNINTGGPTYSNFGGNVKSITSLAVDSETSFGTLTQSTGIRVRATIEVTDENALNVNRPGGLVQLDSEGKIPEEIVSTQFNWFAGKKILWCGTSIPAGADGGGAVNPQNRYPDQCAKILGARVDNQATGSTLLAWTPLNPSKFSFTATIAELEAAFPEDPNAGALSYENKIIGKEYDYIVLDYYANDRTRIRDAGQTAGDINSTDRATYYGAWNYIIDKIYEDNPNAKIIIASSPNIYTTANTAIDQAGEIAVAANIAIAQKYPLPHANQALEGYVNSLNYLQYNGDGTHPIDDNERKRRAYFFAEFFKSNP